MRRLAKPFMRREAVQRSVRKGLPESGVSPCSREAKRAPGELDPAEVTLMLLLGFIIFCPGVSSYFTSFSALFYTLKDILIPDHYENALKPQTRNAVNTIEAP